MPTHIFGVTALVVSEWTEYCNISAQQLHQTRYIPGILYSVVLKYVSAHCRCLPALLEMTILHILQVALLSSFLVK